MYVIMLQLSKINLKWSLQSIQKGSNAIQNIISYEKKTSEASMDPASISLVDAIVCTGPSDTYVALKLRRLGNQEQ
jgi:hypothetical protein